MAQGYDMLCLTSLLAVLLLCLVPVYFIYSRLLRFSVASPGYPECQVSGQRLWWRLKVSREVISTGVSQHEMK